MKMQLQSTTLLQPPAAYYDPILVGWIKVYLQSAPLQLELAPRQETDTSERSRVSIREQYINETP